MSEKVGILSDPSALYVIGSGLLIAIFAIVMTANSGTKKKEEKITSAPKEASGSSAAKKKSKNKKVKVNEPTSAGKVSSVAAQHVEKKMPETPVVASSEAQKYVAPDRMQLLSQQPEANPLENSKKDKKKKSKPATSSVKKVAEIVQPVLAEKSGGAVSVSATPEASKSEQSFYSKDSIENFDVYEEIGAVDSNDGWTAVEVPKKGKRGGKQQATSEDMLPVVSKEPVIIPVAVPAPVLVQPPTPPPVVIEDIPSAPEPIRMSEPAAPPVVLDLVRKEVKIDPKKVGFIIGPKGATLRSIETATECEIMMPKTERDQASPATICVTGSAAGTSKAIKAISDLATKGYSTLIAGEGFQENSISIPIKSIPDIIGRNGSVIKIIQDMFKVKLNLPDTSNRDASITKVRIAVAGLKDQVAQAKEVIKEITQYFYSRTTHPDTTHQELDVPAEAYSLIIGPRGSEIRHIQSNFKVSVHIPNSESFVQKVIIVGNAAAVEKAKTYIQKMIGKAETRQEEYEASKDAVAVEEAEPHEVPYEIPSQSTRDSKFC